MGITKCKLGIGFTSATKSKINAQNVEAFCINPKTVDIDDLGMVKYGRLIIPATGWYRLTAHTRIANGNVNDFIYFGFDTMNSEGTDSRGKMKDYAETSIQCDPVMDMFSSVTDVVHFTAGEMIACSYLRGSSNNEDINIYSPTIVIEKLS